MSDAKECGSCKFYRNQECRRFPPIVHTRNGIASFPFVESHEWCGEHSPKEDKK